MKLGWLSEVIRYGSDDWGLISSRFRAFSYCDQVQIDLGLTQFPLHALQLQELGHQVNSCLLLVPQLRMHAAFSPVFHISIWCGAWAWKHVLISEVLYFTEVSKVLFTRWTTVSFSGLCSTELYILSCHNFCYKYNVTYKEN